MDDYFIKVHKFGQFLQGYPLVWMIVGQHLTKHVECFEAIDYFGLADGLNRQLPGNPHGYIKIDHVGLAQ